MKTLLVAVACAIAVPAAAQAAPAQRPAGPQPMPAMQGMDHGQHQGQHGQHGQHEGHAMMGDCCADKDGNGKMDCCEKGQKPAQAPAKPPSRN